MDILTFLPVEICERILCYLNVQDITNCSLVCRSWYNLTNSCDLIWKRFCKQEEVIKQDWDYNVTEWFPWTSEWKMYFLNFKKTIYNWKKRIFKEFTIDGKRIYKTVYDSKTLVVAIDGGLDVYTLCDNSLEYCVSLCCEGYRANYWLTNTTFIIVICETTILVYRSMKMDYIIDYMLRIEGYDNLVFSDLSKPLTRLTRGLKPHDVSLEPRGMCLIGDTFYYCNNDVVYAWELRDRCCLLQLNDYNVITAICDTSAVYICYNGNKIDIYNEAAKLNYTVCVDFKICRLLLNNHILIALGVECFSNLFIVCGATDRISVWNKQSGQLVINGAVMFLENAWIYKASDVIVQLETIPLYYLIAQNLRSGVNLWTVPVNFPINHYLLNYQHKLLLYNSINDILVICIRSDKSLKSYFKLHICDSKTGQKIYTVYNAKCNSMLDYVNDIFVGKDILMFINTRNDKVTLRLYR